MGLKDRDTIKIDENNKPKDLAKIEICHQDVT